MSIPVVKLATVLVRQISKPVANNVARFVMANSVLRKPTVTLARYLHSWDVWIRHYGEPPKKRVVGEMVEQKAVELASSFLTEAILYSIGAGTVLYQHYKSVAEGEEKKLAEKQARMDWEAMAEAQREELARVNEEQTNKIYQLMNRLDEMEERLLKVAPRRRWL